MFESVGQLFWYRLVFLAELLIGEGLFCFHLKRRNRFVFRLTGSFFVILIGTLIFPIAYYNAYYISLMFFYIFLLTVGMILFCFDVSVWSVVFCAIAGYTVQHIAYTIYNTVVDIFYLDQIIDYLIANNPYSTLLHPEGGYSIVTAIAYVQIYFCTYWFAYRILGVRVRRDADLHIKNRSFVLLSGIIIIVDVFFNMITVFYTKIESGSAYLVENAYNLITCFLALEIQFSQLSTKEVERELETIRYLWRERNNQYEMTKQNIELINIKCHDLKHQIRNLTAIDEKELQTIEKALTIYDSTVKTGNEALDVILTEKALLCEEKKIRLTMIIDGKLLDFIAPYDIYSLFGNALDNAIEAVLHLDEDRRNISVIVKSKGQCTIVHLENYFAGDLALKDGIPQTTKENSDFHGYGVLSMKSIVESYGGTLSIEVKKNIFNLNFLFSSKACVD